jgi:hypothetical protein
MPITLGMLLLLPRVRLRDLFGLISGARQATFTRRQERTSLWSLWVLAILFVPPPEWPVFLSEFFRGTWMLRGAGRGCVSHRYWTSLHSPRAGQASVHPLEHCNHSRTMRSAPTNVSNYEFKARAAPDSDARCDCFIAN